MSTPSRVLLIETQGHPGGMWHYASALARALVDAGLDITLATIRPFETLEDHAGIRMRSLGDRVDAVSFRPLGWLRRGLGQAERWVRLRQIVREVHPEIIHLHNCLGRLDFLGFRALRALGIPLVLTAHDPRPDTGLTRFDWARYRSADAIIVHSLNGIRDLTAGGISADRIRRVHHGNYVHLCKDPDLSSGEARRRIGLRESDRIILFFGTILPYKGLDMLIDAFAHIAAQAPNARLVIAGEPLESFAPYDNQITRLGLAERVIRDLRYIPFDDLPSYFLAADVVAFPYRHVYQSGALQLAYGYGRAVVVTDVGGMGEVVAQEQSGLVVPPGNVAALVGAIRRLLEDRVLAETMGRRGRLAAETTYSWRAVAQDVIEVYRGVLEGASRSAGRIPASAARRP